MKTIIALTFLALATHVFGVDKIHFETAKEPKVGESSGFELHKDGRAVLKIGAQNYIVLELTDSSYEDGGKTFTEACSISWTLITPATIQTNTTSAFIRYRSKKTGEGFLLTAIGGSDSITFGDVLTIGWSYASPKAIFLYPSPGTKYATTKVEDGPEQAPTAPKSTPEDQIKPAPEAEGCPRDQIPGLRR